jgi:predicted nucleic-acid-binding protein
MRAIDTNVLVRLLLGDDEAQAIAAERFVERGAWIPHLVLAETAWVFESVYRLKPGAIATAFEMLLEHRALVVQEPETVAAALRLFRSRPSLGFSDCLIVETARRSGHLPLGTFDRRLAAVDDVERIPARP